MKKYYAIILLFMSINTAFSDEKYYISPESIISNVYNNSPTETISSKNSTGDIIEYKWFAFKVENNNESIETIFIGSTDDDNVAQSYIEELDYGIYFIVLDVVDIYGVHSSSSDFIIIDNEITPRVYHKVGKAVIKRLIRSLDGGYVGNIIRDMAGKRYYNKIQKHVIPELRKLLKWDKIFKGNLETSIANGLEASGLSWSKSRKIAVIITSIFW